MRDNLILTRAAELDALGAFREFIGNACERLKVPQVVSFELQLACDEAATNVIQHGYAGMNPGSIMLELRPKRDRITMVLTDFGHPFEPVPTEAPDVEAMMSDSAASSTGFGLYFIYRTMSEVSYYTDEQGNHLVLMKTYG